MMDAKPPTDTLEAIIGEQPVLIVRGNGPMTDEERELLRDMDAAAADAKADARRRK